MRLEIKQPHLIAYVRECWVLAENRRHSAESPTWTDKPTLHALVLESITVEETHRQQGLCRAFIAALCQDKRFDMVIVEGVQNPHLADALHRWGWDCDPGVMDFYWPNPQLCFRPLTEVEAQFAYDAAPTVPLSEADIQEIVDAVTKEQA